MKIKNVSCNQFAGIRDRSVSFTDGINVIYGKNESGKSTLVNLISRTLFQNARIDGRSDKEFRSLYFPSARKGVALAGDFADGKISFETENGTYTLSKEWGADSRCTLSCPDGIIRDQKTIDTILRDVLLYGEGVYSDMLFSSQRNTDIALQTILDASKKSDAKQELSNVVSKAFVESDGISLEAIEQAINAKIDEIAGKRWDLDRYLPARNPRGGRWSNGLGEILKDYYALEDAKQVLEEISRLGNEVDRAIADFSAKDKSYASAENAYNQFNTFSSRLILQRERKKSIERLDKELEKIVAVLSEWPVLSEKLDRAKVLHKEKNNRALLDQYDTARKIVFEIHNLEKEVANLPAPSDDELTKLKKAQRELVVLETKLCGMNLNAVIKMFGENTVEVTSLRTGDTINADDNIAITEAVRITVPGVMEMQLSPANVDVVTVEEQIADRKRIITDVFAKYQVDSLENLEQLAMKIKENRIQSDALKNKLSMILDSTTYEALETTVSAIIETVRSKEEIEIDIRNVCGSSDVARFVTATETVVGGYINEYISISELKAKAYDLEMERNKARDSITGLDDIPSEYMLITDPEGHLEALRSEMKTKQTLREAALTARTSAASKLEQYKETLIGDPVAEVANAERAFKEQKELLDHWLHIAEVFKEQKDDIQDNPMQDIAERFAHYLNMISDGKVSAEFPKADKLDMNIYSDNRLLDYGKLSEGTKETVSLAFRLAVLDHLFPDGGGVIVFDDPFTDMDADRTAQACALIQECAKRHQVIFCTCKEDYHNLLSGHLIQF